MGCWRKNVFTDKNIILIKANFTNRNEAHMNENKLGKNYLLLLQGQAVSNIGNMIYRIAYMLSLIHIFHGYLDQHPFEDVPAGFLHGISKKSLSPHNWRFQLPITVHQ